MKALWPFLLLFAFVLAPARAQTIPIKTVPVAEGQQFLLFPSERLGMGGVGIALDDALGDPFVNPAKGVLVDGLRFTGTPTFYAVDALGDRLEGSGRTLPAGLLFNRGDVFGGAAVAWQELVVPQFVFPVWLDIERATWMDIALPERHSTTHHNVYAFGTAGLRLPGSAWSAGASVLVADLNGLDGVRRLYNGGGDVEQSGGMEVYRLGFYRRGEDHAAELLLAHHHLHMMHAMPGWDAVLQQPATRREHDETRGWAAQAGYWHALDDGWRLGGQLGGDWKRHPKIPNYDLTQIPRDPGHSEAYRLGVGLAGLEGAATLGLDVFLEPIRSHTWADALTDQPTPGGDVVEAGEKTVENWFRFHNALVRMGVDRTGDRFGFQLGLQAHHIRYHLDQQRYVDELAREQDEAWTEWTLSAGFGLRFPEFQLRYTGLLTLGTGHPGIDAVMFNVDGLEFASADFLVAPAGDLTLQEARVFTHRLTLSF